MYLRKKEKGEFKMPTYLRRLLVPMKFLPHVVNQLEAKYNSVMTDVLNIGGTNYGVVKAISSVPLAAFVPTTIAVQKGKKISDGAQSLAYSRLFVSDLDLHAVVSVEHPTYNTLGASSFTYTVTDIDGVSTSIVVPVIVSDKIIPVITLTATSVDVAAANVAAWDPVSNVADATDVGDGDLTASIVCTYKETDDEGELLADLEEARTFLGTEGNAVFVTYDVSDEAGNAAVQKTATFTAVA